MKELLDAKIPENAIETRSQAGVTLSYLTGWYVIDRLNQVFGHGKWNYDSTLTKLWEGEVNGRHCVSYMAAIRLSVTFPKDQKLEKVNEYYREGTYYEDVGYGDGGDKSNPGRAHELAIKEAVTDGIKRCAKNLGMSFGLALYRGDDEYIELEQPKFSGKKQDGGKPPMAESVLKSNSPKKASAQDEREEIIKELRATVSALDAKKSLTKEAFVEYINKSFGAKVSTDLTLEQANAALGHVRTML